MESFQSRVTSDQKGVKRMLHMRQTTAAEKHNQRSQDVRTMVSQALTAPSDDDSETYPSTFIAKNDHYTEALDVIRHSKRLLDRYDRMDKLVLEASDEKQGATGELWDKEVNDMKARLDKRRSTVLRNIQQCLGVNVVHMDHEEDEYMDVEGMVNEGSRNTAPPARNQLKDALRYAERGVKRMTKPLPRDEDHI